MLKTRNPRKRENDYEIKNTNASLETRVGGERSGGDLLQRVGRELLELWKYPVSCLWWKLSGEFYLGGL